MLNYNNIIYKTHYVRLYNKQINLVLDIVINIIKVLLNIYIKKIYIQYAMYTYVINYETLDVNELKM